MDGVRRFFYGPTPEEQKRICNQLVRKNRRALLSAKQTLQREEKVSRQRILATSKRAQRNPSQQKQAAQDIRILARRLLLQRKQIARLTTSEATLDSVAMQVNEAAGMRKIAGSLKTGTDIMKNVNTLIRLPALTDSMRQLSEELVKAGIMEEMVGDLLPDNDLLVGEDEEAESEIDMVLAEILKDKVQTPGTQLPSQPAGPVHAQHEEEDEELDSEEMLAQMRGRLEALKS